MNFLAHCFLSFNDEDVLVGNFIGDFVKGSAWKQFAPGLQRGILLHRTIDAFTDTHALVRRGAARLRPYAGRYAAPVLDILYDHLLASSWSSYTDEPLGTFINTIYEVLERRAGEFPAELAARFPYMLAGRFLDEYKTEQGMQTVLSRFSRRVPLPGQGREAWLAYSAQRALYEAEFRRFFPELIDRAHAQLNGL